MKSYTDLKQSKKLIKILPIESADWHWEILHFSPKDNILEYEDTPKPGVSKEYLPCWSLAALYEILGSPVLGKTDRYFVTLYCDDKEGNMKQMTCTADNHVDACVDMIRKLHEQKLL